MNSPKHHQNGRLQAARCVMVFSAVLFTLTGSARGEVKPAVFEVPPAPATTPDEAADPQNPRTVELWQDKPIGELKATIKLRLPENERLVESETLKLNNAARHLAMHGSQVMLFGESRPWMLNIYQWEPAATRHLPLYFEEPNLERMGYTYFSQWGNPRKCEMLGCEFDCAAHADACLQPIVSAVHFFARAPLLPYMAGVNCPFEPVYTLGADRTGSPLPYRGHRIPISLKGAVYQAGFVVGMVYLIP
jgi:hypothetical protein